MTKHSIVQTYPKDKVARLLARGVKPKIIAGAIGKSLQWLEAQIADDEELQQYVTNSVMQESTKEITATTQLQDAKKSLVSKLDMLVIDVDSLPVALKALESLNGLLRESEALTQTASAAKLDIQLNPMAMDKITIEFGSNREMVTIGGRSMATMPADNVERLINEHSTQNSEKGQ